MQLRIPFFFAKYVGFIIHETFIDVTLESDAQALNEVVVVGYGTVTHRPYPRSRK